MATIDDLVTQLRHCGQVQHCFARRFVFQGFRKNAREAWLAAWDQSIEKWRILSRDVVTSGEPAGPVSMRTAGMIIRRLVSDADMHLVCSDDLTKLLAAAVAEARRPARQAVAKEAP